MKRVIRRSPIGMRRLPARTLFAAIMLAVLVAGALATAGFTTSAHAASKLAIGQDVFEQLQQVSAAIDADDFVTAGQLLGEMRARKRLNNYERAQIHTMLGNLAYQQEQFDHAIDEFKRAVTLDGLPEGFRQATLLTLAQLCYMRDRLEEALTYARQHMATIKVPDAQSHMLLAQIYYKKQALPAALENINQALQLKRARGEAPPENWLLILNAVYYGLSRYSDMVPVYKQLLALYPKPAYVSNLAAIHGQLEQTDNQLLLLEPLYERGELTREVELINLANLMVLHKVPFKAARLIEAGFASGRIKRSKRNLELLAQSWQLAADDQRSLHYLAEAAAKSRDGKAWLRLAQGHAGLYQWPAAERALEQSLAYGGLDEQLGDARLLLGMVRFYQKDFASARKAFREAESLAPVRELAGQWLAYLAQEQEKFDASR